jgi:peptidoglycan/xylan/chitin deacetylase (PgdA/CDA1 family)
MTTLRSILAIFLVSSCSFKAQRQPSSVSALSFLMEDNQIIVSELNAQLTLLYYHQVLAQVHLRAFDKLIPTIPLQNIYEDDSYHSLIAIRIQIEEIEETLHEWYVYLNQNKLKSKVTLFEETLDEYSKLSTLHQMSLENLPFLKVTNSFDLNDEELNQTYADLKLTNEFKIHEKNIEHLSFMVDFKLDQNDRTFFPSSDKSGNVSGYEFPAKVWALSFDDGPGKLTSPVILEHLKLHHLKATFFQLMGKVTTLPKLANAIRESGMEIASHSYTHKDLTKAGHDTLNKEINMAIKDLSSHHQREILFYRLPYGAGVNNFPIRERIAQAGAIHVFWSIDTLDWIPQTPQKIIARTLALMKKSSKDSGLILFHDIHQRTTHAVPEVMKFLNKDARRVCTIGEIVKDINEGATTVCPK